jgi:putative acetyltransferase
MQRIESLTQRDQHNIAMLLDIWESTVRKTHTFLTKNDIIAIRPEVKQGVIGIKHLVCFFDDEDVIQGFIGIESQKVEVLFIHANARGQGIGKQLLNYALDNLGAKYVDVNEQNEQGVSFYQHMGFHVIDRSEHDEEGRPFPILHLEFD